jgi:hypothetical protein
MSVTDDPRQKQLKKFEKLPEEWRQSQLGAKTQEVYETITKVAIATVQLDLAKELDADLASLKEQVKTANEPYSEGRKTNNLKIQFLVDNLKSRGENVPDIECFLSAAAKKLLEQQD